MKKYLLIPAVLFLFASAAYTSGDKTYTNPVLVDTYPMHRTQAPRYDGILGIGDPAVILFNDTYYLYPTGDNHSYRVYLSDDLIHWKKGPKVFETRRRGVWAPDVFFSEQDRKFYLYYTAERAVGVAEADRPDGIFVDKGVLIQGAIDAHLFRDDDGAYYLYYARYPDFALFVQPMETPLKKKGKPLELLSVTEPWEMKTKPVIEAPWMIKHGGIYYLLYSAGSADSEYYAMGYATSKNAVGPFVKYQGNPFIKEGEGVFGPGHAAVTRDNEGQLWLVYHQQKDSKRGWNRIICIDPLWFDESGVLHGKATRGIAQSAPVSRKTK